MGMIFKATGLAVLFSLSGYKALDVVEAQQATQDRENAAFPACVSRKTGPLWQGMAQVSVSAARRSAEDFNVGVQLRTPEKIQVNIETYGETTPSGKPGHVTDFKIHSPGATPRYFLFLSQGLPPQDPSVDPGDILILPVDSYEAEENEAGVNLKKFTDQIAA